MPVTVRREQLLDAGIALFARRSWEEVSIDEIAGACGVSRGLLYHYFDGKREYYVAAIERAAQRVRAVAPDPALAPRDQLRSGLERFFASIERDADAHAALRRVAPADDEVAAILERDRSAFAHRVLVGMGMPRAGGGSPLAHAAARAWIAAVEAAGLQWLHRRDLPREHLIAVLAQALLAAMKAAAAIDPTIELPAEMADGLSLAYQE